MKKHFVLISAILFFSLLVACTGGNPPTTSNSDKVATIVAGTLAAMPTSTSVPTAVAAIQTTSTPAVSQVPNLNLDDFLNKELVGENDHYSIYLINSTSSDNGKTGEIIVYDKNTKLAVKMNGSFTVFGKTLVYDNGKGEYILLSVGTYTSRSAIVLSLGEQKQAVNTFCMSGQHLFWNDYIIINNCDSLQNRPWGAGEAPSVTAINLKTGTETIIAKSDLTHQYSIKQIESNTLHYIETYVENEADWQNQDKQKTGEKTSDLTLLGNN
jgi:hypothetical protein